MATRPERLLAFEDLKTHLREAVEMIAGSTEPLLYRNHLFALYLLKRLNDLFDERCNGILQEALQAGRSPGEAQAIAADPDEHRFFVPPTARWTALLNATEHLGAQLERACAELERYNSNLLSAVLTPLRFERSGEHDQHEALLRRLLIHFDKLPLGDQALQTRALVGQAGNFLIEYLAMSDAKKFAGFTSPAALMQLLAELLEPEAGMRVCDPACGAGGALLACVEYLQQRGHHAQALSLYGQEYEAGTWALCKMNLLLHDLLDTRVTLGSTLSNPLLDEEGRLLQFDRVIAEPPFTLPEWEHEEAARVSYGRFEAGLPPARRGEFAFVQHIAATLNARGRAAVIVPHGVLFRGGSEKQIRAAMLQPETDLVEAVLALPEGARFGLKAPLAILILNRNKSAERQQRVLFVDAQHVSSSASAFVLHEETRLKLVALYRSFGEYEKLPQHISTLLKERLKAEEHKTQMLNTPQPRATQPLAAQIAPIRNETHAELARTLKEWAASPLVTRATANVSLHEIAATHDYSLSVARYVAGPNEPSAWNVSAALAELEELDQQKLRAEQEMQRMLQQLGY